MNILVNYADSRYESARKWNSRTGKWLGNFDKIYEFSPNDIDSVFRNNYSEILNYTRGNGLWLWKPYFINKVINESKDGDCVFYIDSGAFFIRNPKVLLDYLNDTNPIFICDQPLIESCWTKPEVFDTLEAWDFAKCNQIWAGFQVVLVNSFTRCFYKKWLNLCCQHNLISPSGLGKFDKVQHNYGTNFVAHREDQSLFSVLCHINGIIPHRDISQRGYDPKSFYNPNYAFSPLEHPSDKYKTIIFLHKSPSLNLKFWLRYIILHIVKVFK